MRIRRMGFTGLMGLLVVFAVARAQVVENPAKARAADAGRVISPKLVWSIEDDGDKFFFKFPRGLQVGPDGAIFIREQEQVLQFDKDGRFQRNLFKKGQGPGELQFAGGVAFRDGAVILQAIAPPKLLWFDAAGKHLRDMTLAAKYRMLYPFGWIASRWLYETYEFPRHKGDPADVEQPHRLIVWDEKTGEYTELASFDVTVHVVPSTSGGGGGFFSVGAFIARPFGDASLAISHTPEYLIKVHDVKADKTIRQFRRAYQRIPPPALKSGQRRGSIMMGDKTYEAPVPKYLNDVLNLFTRGDRIWVVTSTQEKGKGALIDIFDAEGVYRDAFYINLGEEALTALKSNQTSAVTADALLTIERTEEGTFQLKKYELK